MRRGPARLGVAVVAAALMAAGCAGPGPAPFDPSYIFDQTELRTYELHLSEEALATLDADPAAEQYVEGSMTFEGTTVDPVGIRYKGSIGAFVGCLSGRDFTRPSGRKTCTKLSMKIKINWDDPDGEFYGLRKLQFHSQNLDPTQMRERLGYWLFREMGVPAPRSVHARVMVNGEFLGVFALTEEIDGRFTRENFNDGTGNLYKEVWPITNPGEVRPESELVAALITNEDQDPSTAMLQGFARDVLDADEPEEAVRRWMDVDEALAMAAVDRTIRHDDGVFHWYCDRECFPHNYFWYEDPTARRVHLIPWDLDNAFQNIVTDVNPVTPIKDAFGEISNECEPFSYGAFRVPQRSAACDPILGALAQFDAEYEAKVDEFLAGPFAPDRIDAVLDSWEAQIADATREAANRHGDALPFDEWQQALEELRNALDVAREKALG